MEISLSQYKGSHIEKSFVTEKPFDLDNLKSQLQKGLESGILDQDTFDKAMEDVDSLEKGKKESEENFKEDEDSKDDDKSESEEEKEEKQ